MPSKQITGDQKKESFKETMLKEIVIQLTQAFPALRESLGQKKFDKRIRKAGKLLIEGIKPVEDKKPAKPATVKKVAPKKSTADSTPKVVAKKTAGSPKNK